METRKETLNALKLCRFCLSQDETLTSLYDRSQTPKNSVPLALKILSCVSIEVFPSDKMPSFICNRCKFFMDISYEFKQLCRQSDENVLQYIQSGIEMKSVPWPPSLQKLFRVATKSAPELAMMKTIVEGGATVQVTAQESDSEEEDDEDVYNIKIGDGSEEGPKNARVKLVTTEKGVKGKIKQVKDNEEVPDPPQLPKMRINPRPSTDTWDVPRTSMGQLDMWPVTAGRDGCWPCSECDCTYPLQQLLALHKQHKHKERTVACDQCDAKFFNNSDLGVHQLRHRVEEPLFQCVVCDKTFKRHILLKRHEKTVHADLAQLPCPSCPATFLSHEELETHSQKHAANKERRFTCDVCGKRFFEKSTMARHKINMHENARAFACVYCPARFSAVSKLTRHVRAHAGDRSYPCKYCNKSFIKSHHYTRHLRLKHREANRTCRGPFGESIDQYRCEQCEDSFGTQDELIYHSAIHATQNLICPLCQEKFEDVDAVTAHIKSHVNGTEFMCDLCELVFTSKDKLDIHIANAHDEEMLIEDLAQDESSMEMEEGEEEDDDNEINVKEEDDHMVVEIKKANDFMLSNVEEKNDAQEKIDNTNSEESESEVTYTELPSLDALPLTQKMSPKPAPEPPKPAAAKSAPGGATLIISVKPIEKTDSQTAPILRRAEEIKRKALPEPERKLSKTESNTGASDKSLRLLEKELQELKRTNTRSEAVKTPVKNVETLRNRRPQIHTSTPKSRVVAVEEKKVPVGTKSPTVEKKLPERRVLTKENKEPKEVKETKANNGSVKDDKEIKEKEIKEKEVKEKEVKEKEVKEKEVKEKETPKTITKNGANDKSGSEEGIRRSTRPSKIKDYAKMIRDRTQDSDLEDDSDEAEEEYKETEKSVEKPKPRRSSVKASPKPTPATAPGPATAAPTPRKRGRPRKEPLKDATPAKIKKEEEVEAEKDEEPKESANDSKPKEYGAATDKNKEKASTAETPNLETKTISEVKLASGMLVSPTGQTLKKIPIKALPPGVKPLPLPMNARPVGSGEVCEMQIGKKVVKVQKIVMTKAEVEAMAKRGLVEMKDGTMVLKHGIKIPAPTPDAAALKSLVGDETKESPTKREVKATPSRCNIDDD